MALISTNMTQKLITEQTELHKTQESIGASLAKSLEDEKYLSNMLKTGGQSVLLEKGIERFIATVTERKKYPTLNFKEENLLQLRKVLTDKNLVEAIPKTNLNSIKIMVEGEYTDYAEFLLFLKEIQSTAVSIVNFKVSDNNFQITLRIYGT